MNYRELTNEQRRQWLDFMQVDEEYRLEQQHYDHSFNGSMRWLNRNGSDYLHVKKGRIEKSLGLRGIETEKTYNLFIQGRAQSKKRLESLDNRLKQMAPVNRALGLGRVPILTSKILRVLDEERLLGKTLLLVGTNALWGYEAKAGLQFHSSIKATTDADMLWDPRTGVKILSTETKSKGILGLLKKVDPSFETRNRFDYRAINQNGFAVDLIRAEDKLFFKEHRDHVTEATEDLSAAPIFGLQWLADAPKFESYAIGEDGLSVRIHTVDPRAFSLHKIWLSDQPNRDPIKSVRDLEQAKMVSYIEKTYLKLELDEKLLQALPNRLRKHIAIL